MSAPLQKFKELPPSEKTPVVPAKRIPLSFAPEYARAYLELMRLDKVLAPLQCIQRRAYSFQRFSPLERGWFSGRSVCLP